MAISNKVQLAELFSPKLAEKAVFVDLSKTSQIAKISRGGFEVPPPKFDPKKIEQEIVKWTPIPPKDTPRVFTQSIAPGVKVPRGTSVDVVLVNRASIPFNVIENVHSDLKDKNFGQFEVLLESADVRKTLLTFQNAADVPAADRAKLEQAMAGAAITVNTNDPEKSFDRAFTSLRGAAAYLD